GTGSSDIGSSGLTAGIGSPGISGHRVTRHWIVWLDSGHRVTRYYSGHWVIRRDRIIRLDQFIRLGTDIRLGRDIRLKCGCRGTSLHHGRQVLRRQAHGLDTGRMVLVGKNFCFFLVLTTGALQVNAGLQTNGAA
ncbi:unnamed protein product, partial [Staurois parvus]